MLNAAYVLLTEHMTAEQRELFDAELEAEPVARRDHVADFLRNADIEVGL